LRDDQHRAPDIGNGPVHVAIAGGWILEDSQMTNLVGDVLGIRRPIALLDADEHHQPARNSPDTAFGAGIFHAD
jgi:hypothetical protein